jgi:hypothetical protein
VAAKNPRWSLTFLEIPSDHPIFYSTLDLARLLKRVFDIDIEHCPNCGGSLKIIAAIEDPPVIVKILSHLGLPSRAPPRAGAALRFIPNDLRSRNRLPTLADGAARSEFERAVRSGTLSAPPTAASPKPAEATPRFSSNRKEIDNSPVPRYCSGQKKGGLNFLYIA